MRRAVCALPLVLLPWLASAQPEPSVDYAMYCARCHGATLDGTGAIAEIAMTPVMDLTSIAARHNGVFPRAHVMSTIRGDTGLAAHAATGMPGWAEVFRTDTRSLMSLYQLEVAVEHRIEALADFIAARQR